jgi:excisionase family DNA binding protein
MNDSAQALKYSRPPSIERELLSPNDACHVLGVGRSRLYVLMRDGKLKYVQDGGRRKITRAEVRRYIKSLSAKKA